jgi:hypothetical protein
MKKIVTLDSLVIMVSSVTKQLEEFKFKTSFNLEDVECYRESNTYLMYESLLVQGLTLTFDEFLERVSSTKRILIKFYTEESESESLFYDISFSEFDRLYREYAKEYNEEIIKQNEPKG